MNWVGHARKYPRSNLRYYTGFLLEQFSKSIKVTLFYVMDDKQPRHLLSRTKGVFQNMSIGYGIEKNPLSLQGIKAYFFDSLARKPVSKPS